MKPFQAVAALHIEIVGENADEAETIAKGIIDMILQEGDLFSNVDFSTIRVGSPIDGDRAEFDVTLVARYHVDADDEASARAAAVEVLAKEVETNSAWISDGGVAYVEEKRT